MQYKLIAAVNNRVELQAFRQQGGVNDGVWYKYLKVADSPILHNVSTRDLSDLLRAARKFDKLEDELK